ncbi:MAG: HTH-type transcriptional activator IlvY [Gammaproteobacteria bacterium]
MDPRTCQLFLHLADTLHFGQTANRCNLSPSAVSRQTQKLEQTVGQVLIERNNRQATLTPAGQYFLEYARKVIDDWQQLQSQLANNHSNLCGEISVFGSVTASYSLLTQILPMMRESFPAIEIKLRTGDQADGIEKVLDGSEDCAIIARPAVWPEKLEFLPLQQTPLCLIGPRIPSVLSRILDQCLAEQTTPDWNKIPMIIAERGLAREQLLAWFEEGHHHPDIYAQVSGHEAVVSMVSLGFGVALVPELVIKHSPKQENIRVLPWINHLQPFNLGLCTDKQRTGDPLIKALWECASQIHPQNKRKQKSSLLHYVQHNPR